MPVSRWCDVDSFPGEGAILVSYRLKYSIVVCQGQFFVCLVFWFRLSGSFLCVVWFLSVCLVFPCCCCLFSFLTLLCLWCAGFFFPRYVVVVFTHVDQVEGFGVVWILEYSMFAHSVVCFV